MAWSNSDDKRWTSFDEDLDKFFENILIGDINRNISLSSLTNAVGLERFGEVTDERVRS
jgi:hypothetical protein